VYTQQLNTESTFGYSDHSCILVFNWVLGWSVKSHIEYSVTFGHSDHSCILVFNWVSGWCVHSTIEYSVKLRPFRLFLHSSIQLRVRLICQITHWVFTQASAIPIIPGFQYSIGCQADLYTQQLNIQSSFGYSDHSWILYSIACQADLYTQQLNIESTFSHSDHSCILVFNCVSGWSVKSHIEYSLKLRPFRSLPGFQYSIARQVDVYTQQLILSQASAIPIIPAF